MNRFNLILKFSLVIIGFLFFSRVSEGWAVSGSPIEQVQSQINQREDSYTEHMPTKLPLVDPQILKHIHTISIQQQSQASNHQLANEQHTGEALFLKHFEQELEKLGMAVVHAPHKGDAVLYLDFRSASPQRVLQSQDPLASSVPVNGPIDQKVDISSNQVYLTLKLPNGNLLWEGSGLSIIPIEAGPRMAQKLYKALHPNAN